MSKDRALDLFSLLGKIDSKDYDIWDRLTDEEKKELSPLMVMRWMAGTNNKLQLIFLNEIVNTSVFRLGDANKEFLLKLLTVCSNGVQKRYFWVPYKVGGGKKRKRSVELIAAHYQLSLREAEDSLALFNLNELLELAELQGLQKDEVAELKQELK